MSSFFQQDTLYNHHELSSRKPRNLVGLIDAGANDHDAVRLELENGAFFFDTTTGPRTLRLPTAKELVLSAQSGMDNLEGHMFSFVVRNARGNNWVTIQVPSGSEQQVHYSAADSLIVTPGATEEFLLRLEYVREEYTGCKRATAPRKSTCDACYTLGTCGRDGVAPRAHYTLYRTNGCCSHHEQITVTPNLNIPKQLFVNGELNCPIHVDGQNPLGNAANLKVSIKFSHVFASDVQAFIISPNGGKAQLFPRLGSNQNYTSDGFYVFATNGGSLEAAILATPFNNDIPNGTYQPIPNEWAAVTGVAEGIDFNASSNGDWILRFEDLQQHDAGELIDWSITINGNTFESMLPAPKTIPDRSLQAFPLETYLQVESNAIISSHEKLRVLIDIVHTKASNLKISIFNPQGEEATVFARPETECADKVDGLYRFSTLASNTLSSACTNDSSVIIPVGLYSPSTSGDALMKGQWEGFNFPFSVNGQWRLVVDDPNIVNTGVLRAWTVSFDY